MKRSKRYGLYSISAAILAAVVAFDVLALMAPLHGRDSQGFVLLSLLFTLVAAGLGAAMGNFREKIGIVAGSQDAERARNALLERLLLATKAGQIGIWDLDFVTRQAIWDHKIFEQYGLTDETQTITREIVEKYLHPDDRAHFWDQNRRAVKGEPYDIEFRIVRDDGDVRHIHSIATILYDSDGTPLRMVGTSRDITQLHKLSEQLHQEKDRLTQTVQELAIANKAALDASSAKSHFLASMSHELRTPLNAILGFSEMIKDQLLGDINIPQYASYANDVHSSGQHLLDLVNDILDLSKLDAGKFELREADMNPSELIRDVLNLVRRQATGVGVALICREEVALPAIHADKRLLKQVLLNLLSNAIKFTPAGGEVVLSATFDQQGLRIFVKDTGIGMTAADIENAMSPYGQVDSKIARETHGTGLGLPISFGLMKLHGGALIAESVDGKGTTMTMHLPVKAIDRQARA